MTNFMKISLSLFAGSALCLFIFQTAYATEVTSPPLSHTAASRACTDALNKILPEMINPSALHLDANKFVYFENGNFITPEQVTTLLNLLDNRARHNKEFFNADNIYNMMLALNSGPDSDLATQLIELRRSQDPEYATASEPFLQFALKLTEELNQSLRPVEHGRLYLDYARIAYSDDSIEQVNDDIHTDDRRYLSGVSNFYVPKANESESGTIIYPNAETPFSPLGTPQVIAVNHTAIFNGAARAQLFGGEALVHRAQTSRRLNLVLFWSLKDPSTGENLYSVEIVDFLRNAQPMLQGAFPDHTPEQIRRLLQEHLFTPMPARPAER